MLEFINQPVSMRMGWFILTTSLHLIALVALGLLIYAVRELLVTVAALTDKETQRTKAERLSIPMENSLSDSRSWADISITNRGD